MQNDPWGWCSDKIIHLNLGKEVHMILLDNSACPKIANDDVNGVCFSIYDILPPSHIGFFFHFLQYSLSSQYFQHSEKFLKELNQSQNCSLMLKYVI